MIPCHSCVVPGRNPGTSTNVTSGMLNASQVRTNRPALFEASMSSTPASDARLVADHADRMPAEPREPADDVLRPALVHLEELAVVDDVADRRSLMSYGFVGSSGISVSSSGASRSRGSDGSANGGCSRLFCGRNESR